MNNLFIKILLSCFALLFTLQSSADQPQAPQLTDEEFLASLHMQSGNINLPNDIATLALTDRFKYLSPDDTEKLLVQGWHNPPGHHTLGMIVPAEVNLLSENGWGVVITYNEDGLVKDDEADNINYDDMLKQLKEDTREASEEREKAGYGPMLLVGWAETPHYEKSTHKFYWAKEYSTKSTVNSLNYDIRVLGRKGTLILNAIAGMDQLSMIKNEMPEVIAMTEFTQGNRYEDFDSKTDKYAAYGLAALVAGGVAAKMGFFAKLIPLLIAFKKLIVIGFVAIGAFVAKLLGRKNSDSDNSVSSNNVQNAPEDNSNSEPPKS